jgi:hypothetical protein
MYLLVIGDDLGPCQATFDVVSEPGNIQARSSCPSFGVHHKVTNAHNERTGEPQSKERKIEES